MKRYLVILLTLICIFLFKYTTFASEHLMFDTSDINTVITDNMHIDINLETLIDYIQNGNLKDAFKYISKCSVLKIKSIIVYHKSIMYTCFAVGIISCLINMFYPCRDNTVYEYVMICAICVPMINLYIRTYKSAIDVLNATTSFMQTSLPAYFGIISTITNKLPMSVYTVFMLFVIVFQWFGVNAALPSVSVITVCGITDNANSVFNIKKIKNIITNTMHWILGLYTTGFIAVLKLTQIAAFGTDKLVMNGVRYTLSRAVPVVGGFVSEAAGAVITATLILHNSMGIAFVFIIVVATLIPCLAMFCLSFLLRLSASLFLIFGDNKVANIIECFGDSITEIAIVLLCVGVTFILGIAIQLNGR